MESAIGLQFTNFIVSDHDDLQLMLKIVNEQGLRGAPPPA